LPNSLNEAPTDTLNGGHHTSVQTPAMPTPSAAAHQRGDAHRICQRHNTAAMGIG
jgi:hypothetical protein